MTSERQPTDEAGDFAALERQLREMPLAVPPADLLMRLQADIPDACSLATVDGSPRRVTRIQWTVAAAAAVLLIGLTVIATRPAEPVDDAVSPRHVLRQTYVLKPQETDPCSVLPPQPPLLSLSRS